MKRFFPLFFCALLLAVSSQAANVKFDSKTDLKDWTSTIPGATIADGVLRIEVPEALAERGHLGIWRQFYLPKLAGKTVKITVEMKGENLAQNPDGEFGGGKLQIKVITDSGNAKYFGAQAKFGTFDWQREELCFSVPASGYFVLSLGTQMSVGTLYYRNLSIEPGDQFLDLSACANMGFADDAEKNGQGGWTDQGPENDASGFDYSKSLYGNVPFHVMAPEKNQGRAAMVFRSNHFAKGLERAEINASGNAKYLYLLHSSAWTPKLGTVGKITVRRKDGTEQILEVIAGRDIADHWNPVRKDNAFVAARWPNQKGGSNGIYASKFRLADSPASLIALEFTPSNSDCIWIVAGATLSDYEYKFPKAGDFVVRENKKWRALPRPATPKIIPGSALDFSGLLTAGKLDRLIINSAGRLACKSEPDKAVRLFAAEIGLRREDHYLYTKYPKKELNYRANADTHEAVDALVAELRRHGCQMVRNHSFTTVTVKDGQPVFDLQGLDLWDYFMAKCKENGMYVQIDTMHDPGFSGLSRWRPEGRRRNAKFNVLFSEEMREEYRIGMKALLEHENPYTKTKMRDDPVLAIINYNNEQEFAFIREDNEHSWAAALPEWRKFIGDPNAPMFTREKWHKDNERGRQINRFIMMKWREMLAWYKKTLHEEIGYQGLGTLWEMTPSMNYNVLRSELDLITMHAYHAHPGENSTRQGQGSDIGSSLGQFRKLAECRIAGKPFCVNEYASVFWNKFRYEEAFAVGAYAGFQGFDILLRHGSVINTGNAERMFSWTMFHDPVAKAQFAQTALLYGRGDVKEAESGVRLTLSEKAIDANYSWKEGLNPAQSRLSLVTKFGLETIDAQPGVKAPVSSDEPRFPLLCGAAVVDNTDGFSTVIDRRNNRFDLSAAIAELKAQGILSAKNRSQNWYIQESSTDELYVNSRKSYMTVDTPRFQGLCSLAGGQAELHDVKIENLSTNGNIAVASLDKEQPISNARRLLVVYATNALNSNQTFVDDSMTKLKYLGGNPTLVETGRFRIDIKHKSSQSLKVFPLAMNGERHAEVRPAANTNGVLTLDIDTAKLADGPAVFFEIIEN